MLMTRVEGGQETPHHNGKHVINMLIKGCTSLVWPPSVLQYATSKVIPEEGGYWFSFIPRQYRARLGGRSSCDYDSDLAVRASRIDPHACRDLEAAVDGMGGA